MRISDWSSDVCSSDLVQRRGYCDHPRRHLPALLRLAPGQELDMNNGSHLQDRDVARSGQAWRLLFAAWSIALAATLGALFIGEVMGQRPCTLCWHQRAFMFQLAVVLAVACFRSDPQAWRYALPLAGIGWLLSGYHSLLYTCVIPEPITPCD